MAGQYSISSRFTSHERNIFGGLHRLFGFVRSELKRVQYVWCLVAALLSNQNSIWWCCYRVNAGLSNPTATHRAYALICKLQIRAKFSEILH